MKKTKLIIGVGVSAFLAVGIAQTNLQPHLGKRLKAASEEPRPPENAITITDLEKLQTNRNEDLYFTNAVPRYSISTFNGPYTNCTWTVSDDTPPILMTVSTNHTINWATIEELMAGSVPRAKQVGSVQTNRVMTVVHDGATNLVLLKVLGKEEWPSQTRVVQGRRQ